MPTFQGVSVNSLWMLCSSGPAAGVGYMCAIARPSSPNCSYTCRRMITSAGCDTLGRVTSSWTGSVVIFGLTHQRAGIGGHQALSYAGEPAEEKVEHSR